jgi:methionine--tRNA ligase beta chain
MIAIDDFRKIELKIGKVQSVEPHPNADRLLVLKVDLGAGEIRQLVAGVRPHYPDPQALVGRNVVVVANLQPAQLRGVESQGMILAATGGETVSILSPDREVPAGSKVS